MCLKFIFERCSERLADITYYGGEISDLIMVSLIANHDCSSISFDTAEFYYEYRKIIKKYKRSINKHYKDTFIIRGNEIIVNSENIKNLRAFIKKRIVYAIPPMDYNYDSAEDFTKRFYTYESYTDEVLKLFDYFTEQIYTMQIFHPTLSLQLQIYKLMNLIVYGHHHFWQNVISELVFDKLHTESIVSNYFINTDKIKENLSLFDFGSKNISLIKVEDNEIKITDAYQNNNLVLLPYLLILFLDNVPLKLKIDLIYSAICLL